MKSACNKGVIQSRLQMLHVHVFLAAPPGASYKNTPEGRSVQSKYCKIPMLPAQNRHIIIPGCRCPIVLKSSLRLPPCEAMRMRLLLKAEIISKETESSCLKKAKQALNQTISQLWKGQEITIKYFTDGYYENVAGVLDAVDVINKNYEFTQDL